MNKDTILRSTINDYLENASADRPHECFFWGVPPRRVTKTRYLPQILKKGNRIPQLVECFSQSSTINVYLNTVSLGLTKFHNWLIYQYELGILEMI